MAFHRAARRDFEDAALWYEARRLGLGAEFRAEVDAAVLLAAEQPLRFPQKHKLCACKALSEFGVLSPGGIPYRRSGRISCAQGSAAVAITSLTQPGSTDACI
jgi:hypothetical protein